MKKSFSFFFVVFLVLTLFIFFHFKKVQAQVTCHLDVGFDDEDAFDETEGSEPLSAIGKSNRNPIEFSAYKPFNTNYSDLIEGYIYLQNKWYQASWNGWISDDWYRVYIYVSNIFTDLGRFRSALYLKNVTQNKDFYCPAQIWVYQPEKYNSDWINDPQKVAFPISFFDREIFPSTYPLIGGAIINTNSFNRKSIYRCPLYDPSCGFYQFLPNDYKLTNKTPVSDGYVFSIGEQNKIIYRLTPDNRTGCTQDECFVEGIIGQDNLTLYTRPAVWPTAPPPPPPPGSRIFGYVKDEISQRGVPGASIRIDKKLTVDSSYQYAAAITTTNDLGYWNVVFPADFNIYEVRILETNNNTYCEADGITEPIYPSGAEAWIVDNNRVDWRHLPENAGPVTFFDRCLNLPTPTPTNPPPCPLIQSQENGSAETGLTDEWIYYVPFVAPFDGLINKISVKAGNYGGAWRSITCKVTNNNGSQDVSSIISSTEFKNDSGADWRELNYLNTPFSIKNGTTYRLYCRGPDTWKSIYWIWEPPNQIEGKTYRLYICSIPTAMPTPTQAPWIKLKNSSFQSNNNLINFIPLKPKSFDNIDDLPPLLSYFIRDEAGTVTVKSVNLSDGTYVSSKKWLNQNYSFIKTPLNKNGFLSYIKSRKEYNVLDKNLRRMSLLKNFINKEGLYYLPANQDQAQFYIDDDSDLPNYNFVLLVDGEVNINSSSLNQKDNKPRISLAILADKINFNNKINQAFGIFFANNDVFTGENSDLGLKIVGNILSSNLINNRGQAEGDNQKPSFFVVFDVKQYIDLLPYLSIAKYNIKRLK